MPNPPDSANIGVAALTDIAATSDLADLHGRCFNSGWSADALSTLLATPGCGAFTARDGGTLLGFIFFRQAANEAEIITLAVDPNHRRQGIAEALCQHLIAWGIATHIEQLFLEVAETNEAAIGLYRKIGFSGSGRRPAYYSSDNETAGERIAALCMTLSIP